jgi:dihydroorotase
MKKIRFTNAEIVLPAAVVELDLLVEDGKIKCFLERGEKAYETEKEAEGLEIIDCSGKVILPGLIDVHVHFRVPGHEFKEDWKTGSSAAVAGGVTSVCDMPNNNPPIFTLGDLEKKRMLIAGKSYCNYGLYIGFSGSNIEEINAAENVAAVKFYACDSTGDLGVETGVKELFEKSNKRIVVHSEDQEIIDKNKQKFKEEFDGRAEDIPSAAHSEIRSAEAAVSMVQKICDLARETGNKHVHIAHISTEEELDVINEHKEDGVTCEVCPHHLLLSTDDYEEKGAFIRMNPPVRDRSDLFAMWKGLKFGEIDIIATDHAPHTLVEKEQKDFWKIPSGVPELDTLLPVLMNAVNDEGLTFEEVARLCCSGPAELFGMKGKGKIESGYDADLVVVDMDLERKVEARRLFTKCGWSPYEGSTFKGWPIMTFVGGELVFKQGEIVGDPVGKELEFGEE